MYPYNTRTAKFKILLCQTCECYQMPSRVLFTNRTHLQQFRSSLVKIGGKQVLIHVLLHLKFTPLLKGVSDLAL